MCESKFFLDEKYRDFLLEAYKEEIDGIAAAFRYKGTILYVEFIGVNWPSWSVMEITEKELRNIVENLKANEWEVKTKTL